MSDESDRLPNLQTVLSFVETARTEWPEGDELADIDRVTKSKRLSRNAFFAEACHAILVAGVKVETAWGWEEAATSTGFAWDWATLATWSDGDFKRWCRKFAAELAAPQADLSGKFRLKWWSILDLARYLAEFGDEHEFGARFFGGKMQGRDLRDADVRRLAQIKREEERLSMIGHANRYFILRNLGGDFLKPDVWVEEFCRWYGDVSVGELADLLRAEGINCGRFDACLWSYCVREIRETSRLSAHFDMTFMDGSEGTTGSSDAISTIAAFEEAVWEVEGIRVVVRDVAYGEVLAYNYERAANKEWRINELLDKRVAGFVDGREVAVVTGDGQRPHGRTLLRTVRESYWQ